MECRLQLGDSSQKMDFARGAALLDVPAPLVGSFLQIRRTSVEFPHGFKRRLNAGHGGAIELHLFAHVPVQSTRYEALEALDDGVLESWRTRVDGSDRGDLALGG